MRFRKLGPNRYLIRLERGEPVVETLTRFAREEEIASAEITAIGAVENVELAYFDRERRTYLTRRFPDVYELVSLIGNLSWVEDSPLFHLHACLGGPQYQAICGHLASADVAVTLELHLLSFPDRIDRRRDEQIGLNLLDL